MENENTYITDFISFYIYFMEKKPLLLAIYMMARALAFYPAYKYTKILYKTESKIYIRPIRQFHVAKILHFVLRKIMQLMQKHTDVF